MAARRRGRFAGRLRAESQRRWGLAGAAGFRPAVQLVPWVRPLASRAVTLDVAGRRVLVVRPAASRNVTLLPEVEAVRWMRPAASR